MTLRAVDSVLRQSYKNFELIVVDDGSEKIHIKPWLERYKDERIQYYKTTHKGVAHARNFGVEKSQADWICFLDSDDLWKKHKLSEQLRFHDKNRDILISQTDDIWIRNQKRVNKKKIHQIREGEIFQDSLKLCLICCSSVMLNKKLFYDVGRFDETLITCEDYDLWLRILAHHKVGFIKKSLVTKFGGHEDQLSKKYEIMDKYRIYALKKLMSYNLSKTQKQQVQNEIQEKISVIAKGAQKRGIEISDILNIEE